MKIQPNRSSNTSGKLPMKSYQNSLFRYCSRELFSSVWRCYSGGDVECLTQRGTKCVDIEGNVKCTGCFTGYEPAKPPDQDFCEG